MAADHGAHKQLGKVICSATCLKYVTCTHTLLLMPLSASSLFCQLKNKFMKKIPRDAEASNVLIGEVDFLDKPFVSFVRLAQATTLGGLTEVPVPTRWVSLMSPF